MGEETAAFLLSNRIVEELITGEYGNMLGYKKDFIYKCADELGMDPDELKNYV
jgi:hypothetical protein